jgi:hypothetical protein
MKICVILVTALSLATIAVMPAGAQSLRLEDPIRQQERWQGDFDRDQARGARDEARDQEILRNQEDILREMRNQEIERDWRERERQREREQARREREQERLDERADCLPGYHFDTYRGCSR